MCFVFASFDLAFKDEEEEDGHSHIRRESTSVVKVSLVEALDRWRSSAVVFIQNQSKMERKGANFVVVT